MDLTQLEMFNAVAETGSITQAAAKVHRVPSISPRVFASLKPTLASICLFVKTSACDFPRPGTIFAL